MTGESEEITMFPYQLSKVLADQRVSDMVATAERRQRVAAAIRQQRDLTEPSSRLRVVASRLARVMARLNGRPGAPAASTVTSATTARPMGCAA